MESEDAFKALENSPLVKEARLEMDSDGKSGMIRCRKHCWTGKFDSKRIAMYLLGHLRDEESVSQEEYEKVRNEIENSTLPENSDSDSTY